MPTPWKGTDYQVTAQINRIERQIRDLYRTKDMLMQRLRSRRWNRRHREQRRMAPYNALYHGRTYDDDKAALPI